MQTLTSRLQTLDLLWRIKVEMDLVICRPNWALPGTWLRKFWRAAATKVKKLIYSLLVSCSFLWSLRAHLSNQSKLSRQERQCSNAMNFTNCSALTKSRFTVGTIYASVIHSKVSLMPCLIMTRFDDPLAGSASIQPGCRLMWPTHKKSDKSWPLERL